MVCFSNSLVHKLRISSILLFFNVEGVGTDTGLAGVVLAAVPVAAAVVVPAAAAGCVVLAILYTCQFFSFFFFFKKKNSYHLSFVQILQILQWQV